LNVFEPSPTIELVSRDLQQKFDQIPIPVRHSQLDTGTVGMAELRAEKEQVASLEHALRANFLRALVPLAGFPVSPQ
jgi:hypothetical protein